MDTPQSALAIAVRHATTQTLHEWHERCTDQQRAEIIEAEIERRQLAEAAAMRAG